MKRHHSLKVTILASVCIAAATLTSVAQAQAPSGSLRAGVAKSDITTDAEGVRVNDPLFAKALVLDDGTTQLAIVAMDAVAIGGIGDIKDDFLPKLRDRIQTELGIAGPNVLVNATHTHPPGRLLCDNNEQLERTFDAVRRAAQNMTSVKVGSGIGYEDRIMMNRALRLKNGQHWTIRHSNPCPPDEEVAGVGPVDPEIGILRIDRLDGRPFAIVYNFACHPYLGALRGGVTADYPGFASQVIEDTLGHACMALFLQGAAGDITAVLYKDTSRTRDAEPFGTMLGLSTLEALKNIRTGDAELNVINERLLLPRRTDSEQRIAGLQQEQAGLLKSMRGTSLNIKTFLPLYIKYALDPEHPSYYSYRYLQAEQTGSDELSGIDAQNRGHMAKYLRNIHTMEKLARNQDRIATLERHQKINDESGEPTVATEVQGIRVGQFVLITSPAEVLVEVGLNVKNASPHEHTFMAAYSNGYIHYGPPAADYDKGGYEVVECFIAPEWQELYERKVNEILRQL